MSDVQDESEPSNQHVQLTRGATYLIIQNLGVNVILIGSFVILARLISPMDMGILALLQLVNATCQTFLTWFAQAVTKYVAENASNESRAAPFYQALRLTIVAYIPAVVVIFFGSTFLASHILGNSVYSNLFQWMAVDVVFFGGILPVASAALLGLRKFREIAVVGLVFGGFVRQFSIILLILVLRNFVGLVIGWVISDAATAIIYMVLAMRALGAPRFDFPISKLTRFSAPLELATIVTYAQTWFDRALLALFVPLAVLGVYNAALIAFGALAGVTTAMTNMLFSALSSIAGDRLNVRNAVRLATRYACLTLTPLAFALMATSKPALTLFVGAEYVGGYLPLMLICGALGVAAFGTALGPLYLALEETNLSALITGLSVLISLGAAYFLLPALGIIGAAMARALAILLGAIFSVFILRRKMTLVLDLPVITKTIFAGGVMAAVILGIQFLWYSKFLLPVYLLVGVVVYMVLLRLLKAVEVADLDLLKRFFGAKLSFISKILRWILLPSNTKN
jgi:O-antigen/teichoic acid export membrane protein